MASSTDQDSICNFLGIAERVVDTNGADQHECHVHTLTAKFFLNRPLEDLIPTEFIKRAERTNTVQRKPWIFRSGVRDPRKVDQSEWSFVDISYRGVFRALSKAPSFRKGLWDKGCEICNDELNEKTPGAQSQVVYALMNEVATTLGLSRKTRQRDAIFYLRPRVLPYQLEYWTGFRERHQDAPLTSGCLSLEFDPFDRKPAMALIPVSTTLKQESFTSCLEGKFKLLLAQLLIHARSMSMPADKIPDQEIFLIGLHGSKLHLLRAFFPSQKLSSIWCRRAVPGISPIVVEESLDFNNNLSPSPPASSPDTSHTRHIEDTDEQTESWDRVQTEKSTAETPTRVVRQAPASTPAAGPARMERFELKLQQARLAALDNEPDLHTFRVLGSREYDLWDPEDFKAVVHMFAALQMYLLSSNARCGVLMDIFSRHPIPQGSTSTASAHKKSTNGGIKGLNVHKKNTGGDSKITKGDDKSTTQETKPEATAKPAKAEGETYFDSDSEFSNDELEDEALYEEFAKWDLDELIEDGEEELSRLAEEKAEVEQWCEELIRSQDADETRGNQAVSLLDVEDDFSNFVWTGDGGV